MKNKNVTLSLLLLLGVLTSCLPQEKKTQCGENEAFNASQRRCVATQSDSTNSISIANVTPSNSYSISFSDALRSHAVSISDPFNLGSTIRWNLTTPGGSTSQVASGTNFTLDHRVLPNGAYILEVQVLDAANVDILDSRSWTVNIIPQATPTISTTTSTPFSTTISSSPTTIMTTASNTALLSNVNYQWFVNGAPVAGESGVFSTAINTLNFNFNPTSSSTYFVGAGIYSVQLSLTENITGNVYSSSIWTISNNIPGFTSASLGSANSGAATGNPTPTPASIITTLDQTALSAGGFKNDINGNGALEDIDFCVQAVDVSGVDGNGVFVDFLENGVAIPNGVGLQLLVNNGSVCLGDGLAAGYLMDIPANLPIESRTVTAVVYDGFSGASSNPNYNGSTEITRYVWTTRVRQLNTAPSITIDAVNTNFPGTCLASSTSVMSDCTVTQDQDFNIAITVSDDDFDPSDFTDEFQYFRVQFFLDGTLLDGSHSLSSSDCFQNFSETSNSSRYICTLRINSFDTGGEIDPTGISHTLSAVVDDSQSPFIVAGSPLSNTVSWLISTVLPDVDTGASISAFDETTTGVPTSTESFVATQAASTIAINLNANSNTPQVNEGENIVFNISVNDIERDSHFITIFRCDDRTISCTSPQVVATQAVVSSDDSNPKRTAITVAVTEDSVTGAIQDTVFYRALVRKDNSLGAADLDSITVSMLVGNTNPDPVFDVANFNPALNDAATSLIAYSGLPITIDPGAVADPSLLDGTNVSYQWMIAIDNDDDGLTLGGAGEAYATLEGATSRQLVWTPGSQIDFILQQGTAITLKLCVGDNGWDNVNNVLKTPLNATADDCLNSTLDSGEWFVRSFSNMQLGSSSATNASQGEIAVWVDPSETASLVKYMAYVSENRQIIVEKIVTLVDGGKGGSTAQASPEISSIVFDSTTDPAFSINDVTNLTMTGDSTNKALYIAYMSPVSGFDLVHVRRIDISGGKTNSALLHDGKFSWDSGYNDLDDNTTVGAGLTKLIDGQGRLEITVTSDANTTPTMNFEISNLHGFISSPLAAGVDFCNPVSSCADVNTTATAIADAVNDSILPNFQGLTASASGAIITFSGITSGDFLEQNIGATSIGSLMINQTTGQWQLPYINNNASGTDKSKISVLFGSTIGALATTASNFLLIDTLPSQEIVNAIYKSDKNADTILEGNDRILIATKAKAPGEITLFEYDAAYNFVDSSLDLFGNNDISDIKIAISQNTVNTSAYILGRNAANAFAYARVNHITGDFDFSSTFIALDLDNDFELIEAGNATEYSISAGPIANQLFMAVTDSLNSDSYLLNITGALPTIDCSFDRDQDISKCMKIITNTSDDVLPLPLVLGDVVEDVTLASDGATVGEGESDIVVIGYHIDNGSGIALPVMGVLNAASVNVSNDETSPGIRYNIPYIND